MRKGLKTRYTKGDINRIQQAYNNKVEEYSKLTLDELKELFPILGGSYRMACLEVVNKKLNEQKELNLKEAIDDIKSEVVEPIVEQSNTETNE